MDWSDMKKGPDGFFHLTHKNSVLYRKQNYRTPLPLVVNTIIEYDLKSANISALRSSGKISEKLLDKLSAMTKMEREKAVGRMIRKDKEFYRIIKNGIRNARMLLFEENGIQDNDVLSIKNDAVFIVGRKLQHTEFGSYHFVPKNTYAAYMYLDQSIELYYDSRKRSVTFKGLGTTVVEEPDHIDGMIQFFTTVMQYICNGRRDRLRKYLIEFVNQYKSKELPVQYYREFNSDNIYRTEISIQTYGFNLTTASESDKEYINGIYNYTRYILPIVRTFMG